MGLNMENSKRRDSWRSSRPYSTLSKMIAHFVAYSQFGFVALYTYCEIVTGTS